jgi:hypothetical protein
VLRIEPRALYMQNIPTTTELRPQLYKFKWYLYVTESNFVYQTFFLALAGFELRASHFLGRQVLYHLIHSISLSDIIFC